MISLATTAQARAIDHASQEQHSVPALELMNTAGRLAANAISSLFPNKRTRIVILCGPGNNGGDGVVVFRELLTHKYSQIQCYSVSAAKSELLKHQIKITPSPVSPLPAKLPPADVYIDALFGIGLDRDLTDTYKDLVLAVNAQRQSDGVQTISLDTPSGLDSDTGNIRGSCIEADHTITFGIRKIGQVIQEGPRVCGRLRCVDIGFPKDIVKTHTGTHFLYTHTDFLKTFPQRKTTSNKSNYGHVKVWAGSTGMWGAALLTSRAAYRVGTGYVSLLTDEPYFSDTPEILVDSQLKIDNKFTYAVGPGWGTPHTHAASIQNLHREHIEKVILDADALTVLAQASPPIPLRSDWILTPHTKELSRLLKIRDTADIEAHRPEHVLKAAKLLGAVVLLKGFRTLIAFDEKVFVIPTGNAALAKAGSGDVLTGIISGLRAQGLSAPLAALNGAYLHGWMANLWVTKNHPNTLMPSDLLKGLPRLLQALLQR